MVLLTSSCMAAEIVSNSTDFVKNIKHDVFTISFKNTKL